MGEFYGYHSGVADRERCGLFGEMSYLHGKGWSPPLQDIGTRDRKWPQMNPGVPKTKTGLQDCYFDKSFFKRVFDKEGEWTTPFQRELRARMVAREKNIRKNLPFVPSSYTKKPSCPGAHDGGFGGRVKAFSPLIREKPRTYERKPANVEIIMPKKGGPGYPDIGINPYPKAMGGRYDDPFVGAKDPKRFHARLLGFLGGGVPGYFDPNPYFTKKIGPTYKRSFDSQENKYAAFFPTSYAKKKGDQYHGGLSKFPEYKSPTKHEEVKKKVETGEKKSAFYPPVRNRTFYTHSTMQRRVDISINPDNWRTMQPVTFTKEYY